MKPHLPFLLLSALFAPSLSAAPVTWTTATVSGPGDISTAGSLVGAMNVGGPDAGAINGVSFAADPGGMGALPLGWATVQFDFADNFDNQFWKGGGPWGSENYDTALDWGRQHDLAPYTGTVTLGGLRPGAQYQVQLWIVDTRTVVPGLGARVRTVDGTPTTAAGPNIAIGTFTADAATQVITIAGSAAGGHGPQLNMLQLRETARPPIVVTNNADAGAGSLRAALATAAAVQGPDTITFATSLSGRIITLASGLSLSNAGTITVDASALPGGISLSRGSASFTSMEVQGTTALSLRALTLRAASSTSGRALANFAPGTVLLDRCTVSGHNVSGDGGAIHNSGTMTMTHCTLAGNSGDYGGAIENRSGTLTLSQCTLANNRSTGTGSGSGGGAMDNYSNGNLTLTACILAGNTSARIPSTGPDLWMEDGTLTARNCLISDGTSSTLVNGLSGNLVGTAAAPLNARLRPSLSNYGGPTETLPPYPDSPAVGQIGFLSGLMAAAGRTDQRGTLRGAAAWSNDFSSGLQGASARGSAEINTGSLRLTEAVGDHAGTLVLPDMGNLSSFVASFDYIFSHNDYPADGMSFSWGPAPGGIVVEGGINPGHAISFNIYNGGGPTVGRISYIRNGVEIAANDTVLQRDTDRNLWRPVNILLNSDGMLFVTYRGVPVISAATGYTYAPGDRFTFGSRTGGLVAEQRVDNVAILTQWTGAPDIGAVERIGSLNVTNNQDAGEGSLRWAMLDAARMTGGGSLIFDPSLNGGTINLASPLEVLPGWRVTMDAASLPLGLTLSGDTNRDGTGDTRILNVASGAEAVLHGFTLTKGRIAGPGGAVHNAGSLRLTRCSLTGNATVDGGNGGAVWNGGRASLQHCTLTGNSVLGATFEKPQGGAIYNETGATLGVSQCTITGNSAQPFDNYGGGIHNSGTLTLANSILAENSVAGNTGADLSNQGTLRHRGRNHVNSYYGWVGSSAEGLAAFVTGDPGLGGLAYYGGRTPVRPLVTGSLNRDLTEYVSGLAQDQNFASRGAGGWTNDFNMDLNVATVFTTGNGAASADAGSLLMTPAGSGAQSGTIVLPDMGAFTGFTACFDYRWTAAAASLPVGGISFCFGPAPTVGFNELGPNNCHVVSFDLFNTGGNAAKVTYKRPGTAVQPNDTNISAFSRLNDANKWNTITITLKPDGKLTVKANGFIYLSDIATGYTAAHGRIFSIGSRNGAGTGASEQRLDDLTILTNPAGLSDLGAVDYVAGPQNATVMTRADAGPGSLRDTIAAVATGSSIGFSPALQNQEIALLSELDIDKALTLDAGTTVVTLGGSRSGNNNNTRHLRVRSTGTVTVKNLTFRGGTGAGFETGYGGALHNAGNLTLERCTFTGNGIPEAGGAILNGGAIYSTGPLVLSKCTVYNNTAYEGGGVRSVNSALTATQCTFSDNLATIGGGVSAASGAGTVQLTHCTFSGNRATGIDAGGTIGLVGGGGVFLYEKVCQLTNCIVAGNTSAGASYGPDVQRVVNSTLTTAGRNLFSDLGGTGLSSGSSVLVGAPLLAPPGNFGGPTQTRALEPGSPARNAAAVLTPAITTDQRGYPIVGAPDLGAYEAGTWLNYEAWAVEVLPPSTPPGDRTPSADPDGDGATNEQECGAFTNPLSAASILRIASIARSGANLVITFPTVSGRNYTLWESDALGTWTSTSLASIAGNGSVRTFTIPAPVAGTPKRFYRVQAGP